MRSTAAFCIFCLGLHRALAGEATCSPTDGSCAASDEAALVQKEMLMRIAEHGKAVAKEETTSEAEEDAEYLPPAPINNVWGDADIDIHKTYGRRPRAHKDVPKLPKSLIRHAQRYFEEHPDATEAPVDSVMIPRDLIPETKHKAMGTDDIKLPKMVKHHGKMVDSSTLDPFSRQGMLQREKQQKLLLDAQQTMQLCAGNMMGCQHAMTEFQASFGPEMSKAIKQAMRDGNTNMEELFVEAERVSECPKHQFHENGCGMVSIMQTQPNFEEMEKAALASAPNVKVELFDKGFEHEGRVVLPIMIMKFPKNETAACCEMYTKLELNQDARYNEFVFFGNETIDANIEENMIGLTEKAKTTGKGVHWQEYLQRRDRLWADDGMAAEATTKKRPAIELHASEGSAKKFHSKVKSVETEKTEKSAAAHMMLGLTVSVIGAAASIL